MRNLRPVELLLIQIVIYFLLWMWDEYMATLLSLIWGGICLLVLLTSLVVEWIEKSNVPRWYFSFLWVSVLAPIMAAVIYSGIVGGIKWMVLE
jgi:hypothetical protein